MSQLEKFIQVQKVDQALGLIFGYAIVCKVDGKPFFDSQNDHIPEDAMLKAAADFMQTSRPALDMHEGDSIGTIVFAFPMTSDIAKSMGMMVEKTGLIIAVKPDDPAMVEKFATGERTGFSIGGQRIQDEKVN